MDEKTKELVGIAASICGHCRPCFLYHFKQAQKLNVPLHDIIETIEFSKSISAAGDNGMYEFVTKELNKKKEDNK